MPKKRYVLGIIFNFNPSWMGGIIYILNLIRTLDFIEEEEKPEIILFYKPELKKFLDQVKYPYLKTVEWDFPTVYRGYFKSWIRRKNVFYDDLINRYSLDGVYPANSYPVKNRTKAKIVAWYADLQHKYYPEFFSRLTLLHRHIRIKLILRNASDLIVSSESVKNDFHKFYKVRRDLKMHVFHFTSVNEDYKDQDFDQIRTKFSLPEKYFMVSNQFHKHKNHRVLLKALIRLKEKGHRVHLAMTGRFPDADHSPYMQELHQLINDHDLRSQISLLGIIPRNEQLILMRHSQAVLQPSLFEGWSTVIEDAISLQVPVVASSLPVNIEHLGPDGNYFDPHDDERLAEILMGYPERNLEDKFYQDYDERVRDAAGVLAGIFME